MSDNILSRLKKLQKKRGDVDAFANHDEFLPWSDSVLPLLEFDAQLYQNFRYWSDHVKLAYRMRKDHHEALGESIGVVNQAITKLELQSNLKDVEEASYEVDKIEYPPKFTLKWLYQHAPISLWLGLGSILITTFTIGVWFSETQLYQLLKNKALDSPVVSEIDRTSR